MPGAPYNVYHDTSNTYLNTNLGIRWSAPTSDGCSPITYYRVYYTAIPCYNYWTNALDSYYTGYNWQSVGNQVSATNLYYNL